MAKVWKSSIEIGDDDDLEIRDEYITNYWGGDESLEKIFPIPLWKLKQLFNAFPSSEVALKVTDIASTMLVDAEWIAFDESLESTLEISTIQPDNYYFVLNESDFEELRAGGTAIEDRFLLFVGRLGKNTVASQDQFYAFFCIANAVVEDPNTSGEGASTGFRVPNT